ncbi:MAG TPA: DeoR/GlpR family DNA-binding transcription regulator, partial [Flavihumibacter sp.]|nr:DeoR/GlpR family DNA-binding transcription regulator [Flavihumibacter sp.]
MLKKERQELIIHEVNLHNKVLVADLSTKISVSEDTVRRDLIELSDEGRLVKVHGGAISNSFRNSYKHTDIYSLDQKKVIAQKAVSIIEDGMLVFTTGGTTLLEMLRILPQSLRATFVTVSVPGAFELLQHPHVEVIIIGGKLSRNAQIVVGGEAIHRIRKFNAD